MKIKLKKVIRKSYRNKLVYYSTNELSNEERVTMTVYPKYMKGKYEKIEDYPDFLEVEIKE